MFDGESSKQGVEQVAKVAPKPITEAQPDLTHRKSVIASHLQISPANPDNPREVQSAARDSDQIADALTQNKHLTEDSIPAYTGKVAELYKDIGRGVKDIAGYSLEDMDAAQAIIERYKTEFPSGYFKETVVSLLPKLIEKGQDPTNREQAVQATFGLLHQYEQVVKQKFDEKTEQFKALNDEFNATSDTDTIYQQEYDRYTGQMATMKLSKKVKLKEELENFDWTNNTEYSDLKYPLKIAPTIEHYTDAVNTVIDINNSTGTFNPGFINSYYHIFRRSPTIDSLRIMNKLIRKSTQLEGDPSEIFVKGGHRMWSGAGETGAGIADFVYKAMTTETTPLGIHETIEYASHVPGTSLARFNQNRDDAIALHDTFGNLRDFIHDQLPDVHDVISSILEYHDTGNQERLQGFIDKYNAPEREEIDRYLDKNLLLDKDKYSGQSREGESVVDVLKRLKENTAPVQDLPAQTGRTELDKSLRLLQTETEQHQGTVDLVHLDKALTEINTQLATMQANKQIGVEPNFILATSWLEHKTVIALQQSIRGAETNQQIADLYKQHWFGESIKFFLRTNSATNITDDEINKFAESVRTSPTPEEAYKAVHAKTTETLGHLSFLYQAQKKDTKALWSGNLADAYGMLSERYTPASRIHRAKETSRKLSQESQEAEELSRKQISEFIDMPSPKSETYPLQPGTDTNADALYQLYKSTKGKPISELPVIQQQNKGSWEIGSIVKALHLKGKPIQYGTESTPLQYISETFNGKQVKAILLDEAGLALGSISIDGVQIEDKNELINTLGLPSIYKSVTKEGD